MAIPEARKILTINYSETASLTTLLGTKWVINETPDISSVSELFNLTFNSNGNSYTKFNLGVFDRPAQEFQLHYVDVNNTNTIVCDTNNGWSNQVYRLISITGGTDVTNSTLIQWLEANATQVEVTSLANTKWLLNNELDGLSGTFELSINFLSNNETFNSIKTGVSSARGYYLRYGSELYAYTSYEDTPQWSDEAYKSIKFTNGTDIENPDLIVWLTENAELYVPVCYKKLQYDAHDIVAEIAIRDSKGQIIKDTYATTAQLAGKQNSLTAGAGINITSDTIKVTGVEYKNTSGVVQGTIKIVKCTQAEYDALQTPDSNTIYYIF